MTEMVALKVIKARLETAAREQDKLSEMAIPDDMTEGYSHELVYDTELARVVAHTVVADALRSIARDL